jgi:hypothetical protein
MIAIVSAGQPSTGNYSAEAANKTRPVRLIDAEQGQHDNGNAGDIVLYKDGRASFFRSRCL